LASAYLENSFGIFSHSFLFTKLVAQPVAIFQNKTLKQSIK
jgi:hypothetical protein